MRQSEMNIRELMHKTGVDRMHVTLINDEPHPALIAFADELEVHWKKLVGGRAGAGAAHCCVLISSAVTG